MSIYDDQFNEDPKLSPQLPSPGQPASDQFAAASDGPVIDATEATLADSKEPESPRRRGCGCGSCLLAFFLLGLICVAFCGVGGYLGMKGLPGWTHRAIVAAVNDSDLDPEAKQEITAQLDRLLAEYKSGDVSNQQLGEALEELRDSPLLVLVMTYAAMESYVEPSGLSDEEKSAAKLEFQRVARGTFEKKIDPDDLEEAFDFISKKDFNGNRQIKSRVSDEELRSLVKECRRVANRADVPNEPYRVDAAGEVKRIVDRALGVAPTDEVEFNDVAPTPTETSDAISDQAASSFNAFDATAIVAVER